MRDFLLISVGAVVGANARYWLTRLFADRYGPEFPWGTLFINITGSFVLGFLLTFLASRVLADPGYRLALGTGFCGAYTTFSTFSVDTITMVERGDVLPAALYAGASLVGSLLGAYAGIVLARAVG
jgi:fluoride exporter